MLCINIIFGRSSGVLCTLGESIHSHMHNVCFCLGTSVESNTVILHVSYSGSVCEWSHVPHMIRMNFLSGNPLTHPYSFTLNAIRKEAKFSLDKTFTCILVIIFGLYIFF